MLIGVYIETSPNGCTGNPEGLTGCYAFGDSAEDVLARMPAAIASFVDWLRLHGEQPTAPLQPGESPQVERLGAYDEAELNGRPGTPGTLLPLDRGYLSDDGLARLMRLLDYSRADLLALTQDLPPATLDRPIPADTDEGEPWPIRKLLHHVALAEYAYLSRLAGPWLDKPRAWVDDSAVDVFERLKAVRAMLKDRLGTMPVAERDRVIYPGWDNRPDQPWTLKKSLRRALEHEREHIGQISALLYSLEQERAPKAGG